MRVLELELANFRNYASLRFAPPAGACVLLGQNAQGKSNLLESLSLLATGKSFRAGRESDMIRADAPSASVSARVSARGGEIKATCIIARSGDTTRKRFMRHGRTVPYAHFLGGVAAVTFVPADLQIVSGPAAMRRRLLNTALSQSSRAYYRNLAAYSGVLAQKNAFLRSSEASDRALLATYNDQLCLIGAAIVDARASYVRRLAGEAAAAHARWVGPHDVLRVQYAPNPPQPDESPVAVEAGLRTALMAATAAELARKMSLVGPHRDDITLELGGKSLARFGSQGQQRTAVLALKAAEYALARASAGEAPILLFDDVLSELDAARRNAFLEDLHGFDQAFITATDLMDLPEGLRARIYEVSGGSVQARVERASA